MKRIINFRGLKALGISAGRVATMSQWRSSDISGPVKLAADIVFKFT